MNVYALKAYGTYGGGMAIVAANSPEEAKELAEKIEGNDMWRVRYGTSESIDLLPIAYDGPSKVLANYEAGE